MVLMENNSSNSLMLLGISIVLTSEGIDCRQTLFGRPTEPVLKILSDLREVI